MAQARVALASATKLASWYVIVVFACVLLIEALFPVCFPAEHAEFLNLSRGFLFPYLGRRSACDVVFDNDQPDASSARLQLLTIPDQ